VLILSHFAGAAEQLKTGALLVNPYDVEEVADTVLKAFRMTDVERTARMKRMRRVVREENVFWWVDSFLRIGAKLTARSPQTLKKRRRAAALQSA
jgi:trehalose 6-phosphate synthase